MPNYKLKELGVFKNGLNYAKTDSQIGCKIIGVADFGNRMHPDYSALSEVNADIVSSDYLLCNNDILFVRSNGNKSLIGRTMLINNVKENVTFGGFCIRFRPDTKKVIPMYLLYLLKSPLFRKRFSSTQQTNINNINQEVLGNMKFNFPEPNEQQKIADCLNVIDRRVENNNRINAELEAMAKTLYDYWFVQFDFPDENGKPYCSSGGAMVWNERLKREIPKGWCIEKIGALLAKVPNTLRIQTDGYNNVGGVPVIDQSTEFIAGYTDEKEAIISTDEGAIVFGDHTRIVKYVGFDFARGADGTQVLLSNNERMPQLMFYYSILKIDLSNYGYARHFKYLKDTFIILPDIKQAKAFHSTISPMQRTITRNIKENVELTTLRDWLLPMLMNGQATVE